MTDYKLKKFLNMVCEGKITAKGRPTDVDSFVSIGSGSAYLYQGPVKDAETFFRRLTPEYKNRNKKRLDSAYLSLNNLYGSKDSPKQSTLYNAAVKFTDAYKTATIFEPFLERTVVNYYIKEAIDPGIAIIISGNEKGDKWYVGEQEDNKRYLAKKKELEKK